MGTPVKDSAQATTNSDHFSLMNIERNIRENDN